jgi:hypothetical protein
MYLSSIQQGIQAQHATTELFLKYEQDVVGYHDARREVLYDWAENHKTSILLNGGYSSALRELITFLDSRQNPYPWASFNEGEDALDGALTCVAIVLPEKVYALASELRGPEGEKLLADIRDRGYWFPPVELNPDPNDSSVPYEISRFELELALELNKYGLAK